MFVGLIQIVDVGDDDPGMGPVQSGGVLTAGGVVASADSEG